MNTLATTNLDSVRPLSTSEAAFAGGLVGTFAIATTIIIILLIIAEWKIFEKAGEKGWKSLIPIYGQYILFKIIGAKMWFWAFLAISVVASIMICANPLPIDANATQAEVEEILNTLDWNNYIPFIIGTVTTFICSIFMDIFVAVKLAKAFGKGIAYILGLIFFTPIVLMVLGFGKAKYDKKVLKD